MRRGGRRALAGTLAGLVALPPAAPAAPPPAPDPATALVALFADTCIAHGGDVAGLRAALAARGIAAMPDVQARRLLVRPGRVFSVAARGGHLAVLSFDDGHCGTVGEDIDPGRLLAALAATMQARGIAVSSVGSAPEGAAAAYRLDGPRTRLALMVNMQPIGDRTQVSMLSVPLP